MSGTALALALGAAFAHAFWNLVLAGARNIQAATAVALGVGLLAFAPVAAFVWRAEAQVWPYLAVTSLLQLTYFALLTAAYGRTDLSFVYPIARGGAPVLVLVASVVILRAGASAGQVGGVLLVAGGGCCSSAGSGARREKGTSCSRSLSPPASPRTRSWTSRAFATRRPSSTRSCR